MGFETEAFENLEEKLEEEIRTRNLHLVDYHQILTFEEKLYPKPFWMVIPVLANFFSGIIFALLLFFIFNELIARFITFDILKKFNLYSLISYNLISGVLAVIISMKFFMKRTLHLVFAFFQILGTEIIITDYFIHLKVRAGKQRSRIIPYSSIVSIYLRKNLLQKVFRVGDIIIETTTGRIFLHSIADHEAVAMEILDWKKKFEEVPK
ncbi:MAG: PH domain-containing protein [Actinobacteria bacterium]|nr:PH domain-containing protein [Actinomycetota bacterium]